MRNKMKRAALLLSVLLLLFVLAPFSPADFGDYAGDSDYGYDSYDSYDSYDYDDDDDDRYDYGGGSGSYGGSGGTKSAYYTFAGYPADEVYYGGALPADHLGRSVAVKTLTDTPLDPEDDKGVGMVALVLLLGIAAIVIVIVRRIRRMDDPDYGGGSGQKRSGKHSITKSSGTRSVPAGAQPTPPSELKNVGEYYGLDPDFSEAALCEKLANWYVRFQNAWQAKDLEELRPCLTDAFYAQMDRQLDAYRQKKQTNRVERIAVLGVSLSGWRQRGGEDLMVARLRTRIVDYVTDDATGKIVRGSDTAEKFMEYEWTLTRKTGVKTGVAEGVRVQNCPNCGGAVNINRTARCPYCDSLITVDAADWAVSAIKGLSQRTAGR